MVHCDYWDPRVHLAWDIPCSRRFRDGSALVETFQSLLRQPHVAQDLLIGRIQAACTLQGLKGFFVRPDQQEGIAQIALQVCRGWTEFDGGPECFDRLAVSSLLRIRHTQTIVRICK